MRNFKRIKNQFFAFALALLLMIMPSAEALGATFGFDLSEGTEIPTFGFSVNGNAIYADAFFCPIEESTTMTFYVMPGDELKSSMNWAENRDGSTYFWADRTEQLEVDFSPNSKPLWRSSEDFYLLEVPNIPNAVSGMLWKAELTVYHTGENDYIISNLHFTLSEGITIGYKDSTTGQFLSNAESGNNVRCFPFAVSGSGISVDLSAGSRSGSSFDGWYLSTDNETTRIAKIYSYGSEVSFLDEDYYPIEGGEGDENYTYVIYGKFTPNTINNYSYSSTYYSVSFDANGGSGSMDPQSVEEGTTFELPECGFTAPEGMEFKAWEVNGIEYQPKKTEEAGSMNSINVTDQVKVKAVWKNTNVKISFVANGGSGEMADQVILSGNVFELPECGFTAPAGKIFKAWEVDGKEYSPRKAGVDASEADSFTVKKNTEIKAVWMNDKVKLSFNANGGNGTMKEQMVESGIEVELPEGEFTKKDMVFVGWTVGQTSYDEKGKIVLTEDTTAYADWGHNLSSGSEHVKVEGDLEIVYDSKYHLPTITKVSIDDRVLKEDVDYTVSGKIQNKVGKYSIEIVGKGKYAQSKHVLEWEIVKARVTLMIYDKTGRYTEITLKENRNFNPEKDMLIKAITQDNTELPGMVESITYKNSNGKVVYALTDINGKAYDPENQMSFKDITNVSGQAVYIPADALEKGKITLNSKYDAKNIELAGDSSKFYIHRFEGKSVITVSDLKETYGIDGEELIEDLEDSTYLTFVEAATESKNIVTGSAVRLSDKNLKGAVWFYALKTDDPEKVSSLAALKNSKIWKKIGEDDIPDAGEYAVALAFDKTKYKNTENIVDIDYVIFSTLKIEPQPLTLKILNIDGNTDPIIKIKPAPVVTDGTTQGQKGEAFIPKDDLKFVIYDEDNDETENVRVESVKLIDENGKEADFVKGVEFDDLKPGHKYYAKAATFAAISAGNVKAQNYVLGEKSNTIEVKTYEVTDKTKLLIESGKYYENFYYLSNDDFKSMELSDFFNVYLTEDGKEKFSYNVSKDLNWGVIAQSVNESERQIALTNILKTNKSAADQLSDIATKNKADLQAGSLLYIAAASKKLGINSISSGVKSIMIKARPVILINTDIISVTKRIGLNKNTGYVNADGKYIGKIKIGIIGKDGKPIYEDKKVPLDDDDDEDDYEDNDVTTTDRNVIKDFSNGFTTLMDNSAPQNTLKAWTNSETADVNVYVRTEMISDANCIELQTGGLNEKMSENFTLWKDQRYSKADVIDTKILRFRRSNGTIFKIKIQNEVERNSEKVTETTEVSEIIVPVLKGEIKYTVKEFSGLDIYENEPLDPKDVRSTDTATWHLISSKDGLESQEEIGKKKIQPVNGKKVKVKVTDEDGNVVKATDENGKVVGDKIEDKTIYLGADIKLNVDDITSDVVEIIVEFPEDDFDAKDKNSKFRISEIKPVYYNGNQRYAIDDPRYIDKKTQKSKRGTSHDLDVKVYYDNKLLTINKDYTLTYNNNKDAESADAGKKAPMVLVTGKGDYKGMKAEINFTILPAKLSDLTTMEIVEKERYLKYNGKSLKIPIIKMYYKDYGSKQILNKKLYNLMLLEYILDENGIIIRKDPAGIYDEKDTEIRFFDIVAVGSDKSTNIDRNIICFEDMKIGDSIDSTEDLQKVDLIAQSSSTLTLKRKGLTTKIKELTKDGFNISSFTAPKNAFLVTSKMVNGAKIKYELSGENKSDDIFLQLLDANSKNLILDSDDDESNMVKKTGKYILRYGPRWVDKYGNLIPGGSLAKLPITTTTDINLTVNGKKLKSGQINLIDPTSNENKKSVTYQYSPDGPVLKFKIDSSVDTSKLAVYFGEYRIGSLEDYEKDGLILLEEVKDEKIAKLMNAKGNHTIAIRPDNEKDDTGIYDLSTVINLSYTIKELKLDDPNVKIEYVKYDELVVDENGKEYPAFYYNKAGHDNDCFEISVKNARNDEYVVLERDTDYVVNSWKDTIGTNTGTLSIKAGSSKLLKAGKLEYSVIKADISKAELYIEGVTKPESGKIYYIPVPVKNGDKTPVPKFRQYAKTGGTDENPVYNSKDLTKKEFSVESVDLEKGTATVNGSGNFEGSYQISFSIVKGVSKVTLTLKNNGQVSLYDKEGIAAAKDALSGQDGVGIVIESVEITYKGTPTETKTIKGWENIKEMFNIYYTRNLIIGKYPYVYLKFKDGNIGDTNSIYGKTQYEITN